jgi:hypothetical protein
MESLEETKRLIAKEVVYMFDAWCLWFPSMLARPF